MFWFETFPNLDGKDGELFENGTFKLNITSVGMDANGNNFYLSLIRNSEKYSLDDLSFVLERVSRVWKEECDVAPAFKNLTEKCTGKKSWLMEIGHRWSLVQ